MSRISVYQDYDKTWLTDCLGVPRRRLPRYRSIAAAWSWSDSVRAERCSTTHSWCVQVRPCDTTELVNLHWLRVPERIQYKLCVLVHRCLNGAAPQDVFVWVNPAAVRNRLTYVVDCTAEVLVPATRHSTIGDRAFAVAGPRTWNNLPVDLRLSRTHFSKHTWSRICLTYPFLQFDCIIDYFCRSLEAACAAYASLNLSLLGSTP